MRLGFIEIAGFRGFKDKIRFDLPGGFVVLTGRNGVGKSTVLDAVDFVLTGTINKYEVTEAKGGGLYDHIWWVGDGIPEDHYVRVGFIDDSNEEFVITRSRERGLHTSIQSIAQKLCEGVSLPQNWPETLIQTTLIRDETIASLSLDLPEQARFAAVRAAIGGLAGPDHTKRTAALVAAANSIKKEQDARITEYHAELGRSLSALTEARSLADRQADVVEAEQIIADSFPNLAVARGDRAEMLRRGVAERKASIAQLEEAVALAERLQPEYLHLESDAGISELTAARAARDAALHTKERADEERAEAQRVEAAEQESDTFSSRFLALLDHGEAIGLQDGHCPLCDAARSSEEFAAAIAATRSRLSTRGARVAQATTVLENAIRKVKQSEAALLDAEQHLTSLETRRTRLFQGVDQVAAMFRRWGLAASPSEPQNARKLLLQKQDETARLERALFILEASNAHDRVTALEGRIEQLRAQLDEETAERVVTERAIEGAKQIDSAAKDVANQVMMEQFHTVLPLLKELYQRLRPHTDWREIEIDFGGRIRASLNFTVGDGRNPQFIFSSGQRRAVGIAFLLAIHLSRPWCHLRSLLLDDPVQHIDDYRSLNLVEVLSAVRRTGRQVIIAVEDPALADVLCRRLRSTATASGRRFDLVTAKNGSAVIEKQADIGPLPREILRIAEA
jgi:chromosome segregation protein